MKPGWYKPHHGQYEHYFVSVGTAPVRSRESLTMCKKRRLTPTVGWDVWASKGRCPVCEKALAKAEVKP